MNQQLERNSFLIGCLFVSFLALVDGVVVAAPPPSQFLMTRIAQKHQGIRNVRVVSQVQAISEGEPTGPVFTETLIQSYPQKRLALVLTDDSDKILATQVRRLGSVGPDGTALDFLLFEEQAEALSLAMIRAGLPIKTSEELLKLPDEAARRAAETQSIARWNGRVMWVTGNPTESSLWIEKESFLPFRMLWKTKKHGASEALFDQYRWVKGMGMPAQIDVIGNPKLGVRIKLTSIDLDVDAKAEKQVFQAAGTSGLTERGRDESSFVVELLEYYLSVVR